MNWFCKKYSVCEKCKVHFEPELTRNPQLTRHPELCPEHRKPVIDLEDRMLRVIEWAKRNWEKLESQALEEETKRNESLSKMFSQGMANMAAQQQAGSPYAGAFGALGPWTR